MGNKPLIEAQGLVPAKSAGESLPPLDCRIGPADTVCLIGSDSPLLCRYLRALGGVDQPSAGELSLLGESLRGMEVERWRQLRQRIGFVARKAPLLSVLGGMANVTLPALYHKRLNRGEARKQARRILEGLGCRADLTLLPAYLSPLERMQLAIARAVILQPEVLFLEEPFLELSLAEQQPIEHYLGEWSNAHPLVLSTRNLHLVSTLATQILFIDSAQVHHFDSWRSLLNCKEGAIARYLQQYQDYNRPLFHADA